MSVKEKLTTWNEQEIRRQVAEQIARAIEMAGPPDPGAHCVNKYCPSCIGHRQAKADAAIARRIGRQP